MLLVHSKQSLSLAAYTADDNFAMIEAIFISKLSAGVSVLIIVDRTHGSNYVIVT